MEDKQPAAVSEATTQAVHDTTLPPIRPASYLWGLALSITAAALVALAEIDAQSARVVVVEGRAWPFSVLSAPGATRTIGWQEIVASRLLIDPAGLLARLLRWHLAVDTVFTIAYAAVLAGLVHAVFRAGWARIIAWMLVACTFVFDAVEDLLVRSLLHGGTVPPALSGITVAKWLAFAGTAAMISVRAVAPFSKPRPDDPRPTLARIRRALMHHRFSVAFVVPLVVLTVLSGAAVLEQLPDVQRRWVTDGAMGRRQARAAVAVLSITALLLALLGGYRTGYARRHPTSDGPVPEEPGKPLLVVWIVGPAIAVAGGIEASWVMDAPVLVTRSVIFCVVPLAVIGASLVLRCIWARHAGRRIPDRPPQFSEREIATIRFSGRALALSTLTIGGLGLIRSFTSMVILRPELIASERRLTTEQADLAARFLILGVVGVVLPWLAMFVVGVIRPPSPQVISTLGLTAPKRLWPRWLVLGGVLLSFFVVAMYPTAIAWLGVSAVAVACLAALIGIPAATGLLVQDRPAAEVFRFLGLARTPLVSMLVIGIVLVGALSGQNTIHRVHDPTTIEQGTVPASERVARPPADDLVGNWLQESGCVVTVNGHRVRPMIMIAAEGGGIRAAYWTVKGLQAIEQGTAGKGECGSRSVLFSSGASGGSVGLTVARFSGTPKDPGTASAVASVERMARPEPLAEAVIGTFVRDPFYGATGVPLDTGGAAPKGTWADRARLLEIGWSGGNPADGWGVRDFLSADSTLSPATGALIMNSTSVGGRCRAWISQVALPQPLETSGAQQCNQRDASGPRTVDLLAAYVHPPSAHDTAIALDGCLGGLQAATAALLTARFPYVTPGGVVGPCPVEDSSKDGASAVTTAWPRTQLIDGGYTENTGLATISDLSVSWLAQVRAHNEKAMTPRSDPTENSSPTDPGPTDPRPTDQDLIIPFVVFLTNEEGRARQLRAPAGLQSELLVPPIEFLRGQGTLNTTDALLQRATNAVRTSSICPEVPTSTIDCTAITEQLPRRVIVVDRAAHPEVTAPLGWVLSTASMAALDAAMAHQRDATCDQAPNEPACLQGYGTLGDLLGYLRTG